MRIYNYCLFKLPIDNTYENVFDGWYSNSPFDGYSKQNYINLLRSNYTYLSAPDYTDITIQAGSLEKSVKLTNGSCKITLPIDYKIIKDYNYIAVLTNVSQDATGAVVWCYFINDFISENDGANASTTLMLEYDVWANNYHNLCSNNNNFCDIEEGHIKRYYNYIPENGEIEMTPIPLPVNRTVPQTVKTFCKPRVNSAGNYDYNKRIVWAIYEWERNAGIVLGGPTSSDFLGPLPYYGEMCYTFVPWMWVNDDGSFTPNFKLRIYREVLETPEEFSPPSQLSDIVNAKEYLLSLSLTYNPPFDFNCYIENDTRIVSINEMNGVKSKHNSLYLGATVVSSYSAHIVCTSLERYRYGTDDFNLQKNRREVSSFRYNFNSNGVPLFQNEIPYNNYPYQYVEAEINNSNYPLYSDIAYTNFEITETPTFEGSSNVVKLLSPNGSLLYNSCFTISKNNSIPFTVDLAREYWRDNKTSIALQPMFSMLSPLSKGDLAQSVVSGLSTMTKNTATFIDLMGRRDAIKNIGTYANLHYATLDRPLLYQYNFVSSRSADYDYFLTLSRGYIYKRFEDALNNTRFAFDFCRTSNFMASAVTNAIERNVIISIFNNGFRRWHINNFSNDIYTVEERNALKKLDARVPNFEPELIQYF